MPETKPTPEPPSNDVILAAIERAICHRGDNEPQTLAMIKEHLGLPHTGWTTIQLRPKLEALEAATLIKQSRRHGQTKWGLTAEGSMRLDAMRSGITLPEAPQHQRWREARNAAGERIAGFRGDLRGTLDQAIQLLEADHEADSTTWFDLSDHLHQSGRLYASAIHCLREWPEPNDSQADIDDPPNKQRARRQVHGWDSQFPF